MASAHGIAHDDTTTRDELLALLASRLGDPEYLAQRVAALSEEERAVVASAHASQGELRALLIDEDNPGMAEDLADRGMLFRLFASSGPLRGEVFVVPDELLALLPEPTQEVVLQADAQPPSEPRWTDPAFSLFALASALSRHQKLESAEPELAGWSQEPGDWAWEARWKFVEHLANARGLLGPGLPRLLDDRSAVADRLWRAYVRDRSWSEIAHVAPDLADLVDAVALRASVVDAAQQLPNGGWLRLEAFSRWLEHTRPAFLREQLSPRGLALVQNTGWQELEWPLLRYFLLGPLYWLGLIAASRQGAVISRRERPGAAPGPEACQWEGASELIAPATAQLGTLLRAERYLVLNQRQRVSRYHLVQAHVAAALGSGGSVPECRELLRTLTQADLPAGITERLGAWDQRFGAIEIRPTVVLEARTPDDLESALAHAEVRAFVRDRLGPTIVEVAAADALELASALRAEGHLPRVDAALRMKAFGGLVDEQVLEFLLVSLLAFQAVWPERLHELEGSAALLERLQRQFPPERLAELRLSAERLAGNLRNAPRPRRKSRKSRL